jgi:tRNA-dihydrouridine synthase B
MISCKTLIHQPAFSQQRFIKKDSNEGPVCFQLAGNDPAELAEAVKRVTDYGADLIDLNCGCPVKKIRSKGAGSKLLMDPLKLFQLIRAMKENTHLPVSIKIRVDGGNEKHNHDVATVVKEAGADFLIVHGRHWTEHYETPCRYDEIQYFVNALTVPVIGNGDIACIESLQAMLSTGCAGVMISRAGVGQPWLIKKLISEMRGNVFEIPSWQERGAAFLQHVEQLIELLRNEYFALLQARKLAKYYARELPEKEQFCFQMNTCTELNAFKTLIFSYFK